MFIGNIVYAVTLWLMLILVAKLGDPEMVGIFTLGFAVTGPVIMFANLRLRPIIASDSNNDNKFFDYLSLRLLTTVTAFLLISCVLFILNLDTDVLMVILIIAIAKSFEAISDIYFGLLQKYECMKRIALSMIMKSLYTILLFGGLMYYTGSIVVALAGLSFAWCIILLSYDIKSPEYLYHHQEITNDDKFIGQRNLFINSHHNFITYITLAKKAAPLGVVALLMSLSTSIPRYVIAYEHGERLLGFYAAITYIMIAGVMVLSSAGQSAIPRLARYANNHDYMAIKYLLLKLVFLAIGCGTIGWVISYYFGGAILSYIYSDEYAAFANELNWIMVAAGLNYIALFLWYAMTALQIYKIQLYIFTIDVVLIFLLSLKFVPDKGVMGAVLAMVILMAFHVIVASVVIIKSISIRQQRVYDIAI